MNEQQYTAYFSVIIEFTRTTLKHCDKNEVLENNLTACTASFSSNNLK